MDACGWFLGVVSAVYPHPHPQNMHAHLVLEIPVAEWGLWFLEVSGIFRTSSLEWGFAFQ